MAALSNLGRSNGATSASPRTSPAASARGTDSTGIGRIRATARARTSAGGSRASSGKLTKDVVDVERRTGRRLLLGEWADRDDAQWGPFVVHAEGLARLGLAEQRR